MTAQIVAILVGANDHCHRIPAHPASQTGFIIHIPRRTLLKIGRNGVYVGGIAGKRKIDAFLSRDIGQPLHQIVSAVSPLAFDNGMKRFEPFRRFLLVRIKNIDRNVVLRVRHKHLPI